MNINQRENSQKSELDNYIQKSVTPTTVMFSESDLGKSKNSILDYINKNIQNKSKQFIIKKKSSQSGSANLKQKIIID